jgi:hypothetical protein
MIRRRAQCGFRSRYLAGRRSVTKMARRAAGGDAGQSCLGLRALPADRNVCAVECLPPSSRPPSAIGGCVWRSALRRKDRRFDLRRSRCQQFRPPSRTDRRFGAAECGNTDRSEAIIVHAERADRSSRAVTLPFLRDKDMKVVSGEEHSVPGLSGILARVRAVWTSWREAD